MLLKEMMEDERNEGIEIGRSEGIKIGRAEGMQKGMQKTLQVLRLIRNEMPDEEIMDITGVSEEDLQAIKEMSFSAV